MRGRTSRPVAVVPVALLLATTLVAGCGDDHPGNGAPASSATASASEEPTASGEPSASATVEPLAGKRMTAGSLSMVFPKDWTTERVTDSIIYSYAPPPATRELNVIAATVFTAFPLDKIARDSKEDVHWTRPPVREPDLEIDGVELYHWSGRAPLGTRADMVGGVTLGHQPRVILRTDLPRRQHEALLASVLASFRWVE